MYIDGLNKTVEKVIEYALYVFIAIFPFVIYQGFLFFGTATRSVNLAIFIEILAIVIGVLLLKKEQTLAVIKSPISLALGLFFLVLIISGISGVDFSVSFWSKVTRTTGIFYFIHLIVWYFLLAGLFREENKFRKFLKVFLISAGIFSIGSLLGKEGFNLIFTSKPWNGFTFGNSTFAAMYLYAAFMLGIYYVVSLPKNMRRWWKYFSPLIFIFNPYFISQDMWLGRINFFKDPLSAFGSAQTSSYTLILSVVLLAMIWSVSRINSDKIKKYILWLAIVFGVLTASVATFSLLSNDGYLQKIYLSQSSGARPIVWELSKQAIYERPFLGWGTDNFDRAFQTYYDNRLLEQRNGGEGWFDRAHNVFIDQTIETGFIGLVFYILIYMTLIGSMIYVLFRSKEKRFKQLSAILIVYFLGHMIELQTAFDTTISYISLMVMIAISVVILEHTIKSGNTVNTEWRMPYNFQYVLGVFSVVLFAGLFLFGTFPIIRAQVANGIVRSIGNSEERLPFYSEVFGSPLDQATFLWRTSYDLQRGISLNPSILNNAKVQQGFVKEFNLVVSEYEKFINSQPNDYRAGLQLAETYIYQRLFNVDNLEKAQNILDKISVLSPNAPQAYWLKSVAFLYQHKFDQAKIFAKKALDLNPNIEESQRLITYIDKSIKAFPEIDLYAFKQI